MSEFTISARECSLPASTISATDPATPPKHGVCLWFTLPKEIRDEILKLAYGTPDKPIAMLGKDEFDRLEKDKEFDWQDDEKPFEPRQYERYIDRLLINKDWLHEATEALFTSKPVAITAESESFFNLLPALAPCAFSQSLGLEFVKAVHIASLDQAARFARLLATQCPRVRRLHVQDSLLDICEHSGAHWTDGFATPAWRAVWTEADVRASKWLKAMAVLSGLEAADLELSVETSTIPIFDHKPEEVFILAANFNLVGRLFVEGATRPYDPAATVEERLVFRVRVPKRG